MKNVSKKTIGRALLYIRTLENLVKEKRFLVSSKELERITGISDVQIRKDISYFGKVGTPRVGYNTRELRDTLEDFLLKHGTVKVALFGVGNLGRAILRYPGFHKGKIKLVAAFDKDRNKVGKKIQGVKIYHVDEAPKVVRKSKADIGIVAVPENFAQEVADLMILAGLKGIVNFAPASIDVPKNVHVRDIDFSIEFLSLFCDMRG